MIQMLIVEPDAVQPNWHWLKRALEPAVKNDPERDMTDVKKALISGEMAAFWFTSDEGGSGIVVSKNDGVSYWILYAAGKLGGKNIETIGKLIEPFELTARQLGCKQMLLQGRAGWVRALKHLGFEHLGQEDGRPLIGKVL